MPTDSINNDLTSKLGELGKDLGTAGDPMRAKGSERAVYRGPLTKLFDRAGGCMKDRTAIKTEGARAADTLLNGRHTPSHASITRTSRHGRQTALLLGSILSPTDTVAPMAPLKATGRGSTQPSPFTKQADPDLYHYVYFVREATHFPHSLFHRLQVRTHGCHIACLLKTKHLCVRIQQRKEGENPLPLPKHTHKRKPVT